MANDSKQKLFLKWLTEIEKVSVTELFKTFGTIPALVMILGFYERWRNDI